jgi:hypothetical protein
MHKPPYVKKMHGVQGVGSSSLLAPTSKIKGLRDEALDFCCWVYKWVYTDTLKD